MSLIWRQPMKPLYKVLGRRFGCNYRIKHRHVDACNKRAFTPWWQVRLRKTERMQRPREYGLLSRRHWRRMLTTRHREYVELIDRVTHEALAQVLPNIGHNNALLRAMQRGTAAC